MTHIPGPSWNVQDYIDHLVSRVQVTNPPLPPAFRPFPKADLSAYIHVMDLYCRQVAAAVATEPAAKEKP
ncbi:hypothetical protein [Nocardioides aurantiacus]|uniref:Uncharacterized protein n=1 Tax=Nocardioides aurantiacus TaxID=86796 RepID=A0A3N2CWF1_9ACTN|nr:hypothetical protein [Nocardioides aurantiacus]ROR91748.1 hypothetical protein EDD33_2623 [Nocardioides aurantiacus]